MNNSYRNIHYYPSFNARIAGLLNMLRSNFLIRLYEILIQCYDITRKLFNKVVFGTNENLS